MLKNSENNGTEEIGLVTPTPGLWLDRNQAIARSNADLLKIKYKNENSPPVQ